MYKNLPKTVPNVEYLQAGGRNLSVYNDFNAVSIGANLWVVMELSGDMLHMGQATALV